METTAEDGTTKTKGQVLSILVDGKPIDNATYTLATNDFMASGGDGYTMLGNYPIENEFSALDEALIRYLSKVGDGGIKAIDAEERLILTDVAKNPALGSGIGSHRPFHPFVPDDSDKTTPPPADGRHKTTTASKRTALSRPLFLWGFVLFPRWGEHYSGFGRDQQHHGAAQFILHAGQFQHGGVGLRLHHGGERKPGFEQAAPGRWSRSCGT